MKKKNRVAWISTHPIQYQIPLYKKLSQCEEIDFTVIYYNDFTARSFKDEEFGIKIKWDTSMLEGYKYIILKNLNNHINKISFWSPIIWGVFSLITKKQFDTIVIQGWNHYANFLIILYAKLSGIVVILRCEATDHFENSTGLRKLIKEWVLRIVLKNVDKFLAIGSHNKNFYLKRRVDSAKIFWAPYCVDENFFESHSDALSLSELKQELHIDCGSPTILYASKFTKRKRAEDLLNAYNKLKDPKPNLLFVGVGEEELRLRELSLKMCLNKVKFLGFKNQNELVDLYAISDIFVLPSVNETWGLVINEAMNSGCAIVASDKVGAAADLIKPKINGYIFKSKDIPELICAIEFCLRDNNYIKMGQESSKLIKSFSIDSCAEGVLKSIRSY